jgi:polyisoprenoid-binding protein YceI
MLALIAATLVTALPSCESTRGAARPALQEYRMDAGHSIVEFSIPFAFSRVKGRFTHANGTVLYDSIAPENSSITVVIDANTIDTGWPNRDRHLRTSDFFDVEKYPTIEFRSAKLSRSGGKWIAEGDLTMHGVTKRIAIPFRFTHPPTRSPESRWMLLNVAGSLRLSRADFAILGGSTFNSWFDRARAATMGDSVDIELEIEGYRADAASQRSARIEALLRRGATEGVESLISLVDSLRRTRPAQSSGYLTGGDLLVRGLIATCRTSDAVKLSAALTRMFPESHRVRLIHGFALAVSGDRAAADRQYIESQRLFRPTVRDPNEKFPQDDETWWYLDQLAQTALELGYTREATRLAGAIAEIYPQTARALVTYGLALATAGDARGAVARYDRAIALDPRETRALEWRRRVR